MHPSGLYGTKKTRRQSQLQGKGKCSPVPTCRFGLFRYRCIFIPNPPKARYYLSIIGALIIKKGDAGMGEWENADWVIWGTPFFLSVKWVSLSACIIYVALRLAYILGYDRLKPSVFFFSYSAVLGVPCALPGRLPWRTSCALFGLVLKQVSYSEVLKSK